MRTRLKVCCISSVEEARLAVVAGADALGLVSEMPSGPGVIAEVAIAQIAAVTPPGIGTFLLTAKTNGADIAEQVQRTGVNTVQIVDHIDPAQYRPLRRVLPNIKLVQVVHVQDEAALGLARERAPMADALLLDSGAPNADVAELGGTGRVHNWAISRAIVDAVDIPVFLAGGLNPTNIRAALEQVRPYGVDLCTGVRSGGRLDAGKLASFVAGLNGPGRTLSS